MLPFGEYRPDIANYNGATSLLVQNVVPRADGYGPWKSFVPYSNAMPGATPNRGFFYARKSDGSVAAFAGTLNKLYRLNATTLLWEDVSGGSYPNLPTSHHWQFAQFGNFVIAVHPNVSPLVYDLTSSVTFANLGGSPPQASYVAVVGRFLVLSGLLSNPYRIQWSGLNATTTWQESFPTYSAPALATACSPSGRRRWYRALSTATAMRFSAISRARSRAAISGSRSDAGCKAGWAAPSATRRSRGTARPCSMSESSKTC